MENKGKIVQQNDHLDFSGLFKLDVLIHLDISSYSFYELGLKKFFAFSSDTEFVFLYIDSQSERFHKKYEWDFVDNPIYCMCFEPSGTWVLIVSEQKILLVPYLPLFAPQNTFDCKWSLSSVTVLPLCDTQKPTSVVWWLTRESDNILIIGTKTGSVIFFSLETQNIVGECKVASEISELQMCFDDSLDLLALLITGNKSQQWKLVLEHRSVGYSWLQQNRTQTDKKEGFMSYIKQLSKDKINMLTQGGSKDNNVAPAEYLLKPTEYLPSFRKGSNNWNLSAQYVNGRHFLTAFEINEGTLILEIPETDIKGPSRTLRPRIKNDGLYIQGLWSQRLIYLIKKNEIEVHSANFSIVQGEGQGPKQDHTQLWSAELIGDVRRAHVMSSKEPTAPALGWKEPTFLCDLQLPRISLEPCLVITNCGAYILSTVVEPCEWVVGLIMRGGTGAEQAAGALGADTPTLMRASADMLMSRGKVAAAQFLYSLSKSSQDGWVARLGVFGRLHELSMYKHTDNVCLGNAAVCMRTLALVLKMGTNSEQKFDMGVNITALTKEQLTEIACFTAGLGLWDLLPTFTIHQGHPYLILEAINTRPQVCRGALTCLLRNKNIVLGLLEENGKLFMDFVIENCRKFDSRLLKYLAIWMNPLQEQFRPVMRDIQQGILTVYTRRTLHLITAFTHIACAIEALHPSPDIYVEGSENPREERRQGTWKDQYVPQRALSCGLGHWALADDGNAKIMMTNTPVNTGLIGRVISVACGRHHTVVLTENGVYSAGDNTYGQLGVGSNWPGAVGDAASSDGALLHVTYNWTAPLKAVAAGHYHSAAIDVGGRLYTWGWNVHGQLGIGTIDDESIPQLVTKLQGRKVESVGCGAVHTVVLMKNGEVWACGAGVFGQLGSGAREKSSVFVRVPLPDPASMIAVGYFHNLAVTNKGEVHEWAASPQMIRAASPRGVSPPPAALRDPHLTPARLTTDNVRGRVVRIAAGWHHSCLIDSYGILYTWGLNFEGQLGSGDRKSVLIPTEAKIHNERQSDDKGDKSPKSEIKAEFDTKALVACGGDFTIYIDDDGRIYGTGNLRQSVNKPHSEREKTISRVLMLKTTKRIVKIPAGRVSNKCMFQQIDRIDIMFPFDIDDLQRKPIEASLNPLISINDLKRKAWVDDMILLLKPWINEEILANNVNMKAKLAYYNEKYIDCFKLRLEGINIKQIEDSIYLTHTETIDYDDPERDAKYFQQRDEFKIIVTNVMSKRIKDISLSILNDDSYPIIDPSTYKSIPCCCDELKYLRKNVVRKDLCGAGHNPEVFAADVIDKCMSIFPVDANLWETCIRLAKDYYLRNKLNMEPLHKVLYKYMDSNITTMSHAVLYSNDCSEFNQVLLPKFYLDMCSKVLDTWV